MTDPDYLRIVSDNGALLVAEQPAVQVIGNILRYAGAMFLLLLIVWLSMKKRWLWIAVPVLGLLILAATNPLDAVNQITIDRPNELVQWRTFNQTKELSSDEIPISALTTASVQSAQGGGRLLLLRKDGSEIFPLNTNYAPAPVQHLVAHEIQLMIDRSSEQLDRGAK